MNSNLFDKNFTQENVQLHIQHGERISWKKLFLHTFKDSSKQVTVYYSYKMKAKHMKEDVVWKFFSLTCRLASCNFIID